MNRDKIQREVIEEILMPRFLVFMERMGEDGEYEFQQLVFNKREYRRIMDFIMRDIVGGRADDETGKKPLAVNRDQIVKQSHLGGNIQAHYEMIDGYND